MREIEQNKKNRGRETRARERASESEKAKRTKKPKNFLLFSIKK